MTTGTPIPPGSPLANTPLGPGATVEQVQGWVTAQLRHDPALDAHLAAERRPDERGGVGVFQVSWGRSYGKRAAALWQIEAARDAGLEVTVLDARTASTGAHWRRAARFDYVLDEPAPVHPDVAAHLDELEGLRVMREAARAAADDPAATLGGPLRRAIRRPSTPPSTPR